MLVYKTMAAVRHLDQGHPIIDFGVNRMPDAMQLPIIINRNAGRISYRFRDIDA